MISFLKFQKSLNSNIEHFSEYKIIKAQILINLTQVEKLISTENSKIEKDFKTKVHQVRNIIQFKYMFIQLIKLSQMPNKNKDFKNKLLKNQIEI
ncbi:unnamed protein product [Paramecium sonneborni]|uniref:Uncharacterized protein n=1 Tax=Paramecium sonneborni TaxID=65129 RepID=A0A8S1QCN3_9CILI|nr:unnamed protein product [Paramecium sonneborni]